MRHGEFRRCLAGSVETADGVAVHQDEVVDRLVVGGAASAVAPDRVCP